MKRDIVHYVREGYGWPPCGNKKDSVIITKFEVKVTCKQCLRWIEKREKENEKNNG